MDRVTLWALGGLVGVFVLSGLALAGLERVRGLREVSRVDGTIRPARAFELVEILGGAAVVLLALLTRNWWSVGVGLGILSLGGAGFVHHARLRRALEWAGYAFVISAVGIASLFR